MNTKAPHGGGAIEPDPQHTPRRRRRTRYPIAETSRLAYERASARRRVVYGAILTLLNERGPSTDDDLYIAYISAGYPRRSRQNIATARRELADAGKVTETGERGLSHMGNPARIWAAAPDTRGGD